MTSLHVRGVLLPDGQQHDLWIRDGVLGTEPVADADTVFSDGYVLPGLVDAHCHVGIGAQGPVDLSCAVEQARTDRDAGVLVIRDCGSPVDTRELDGHPELPRIARAGRHLAKPKRYIPGLAEELSHEEALPAAVAEQARFGDGWVKLVGDWIDRTIGDLAPVFSDEILAEAIAAAHREGARVTAHVFGADALPGLLNAGIDCLEHGTGLTSETIELMVRNGTALVPTLINVDNFPKFAAAATKYPTYARHMTELYERADTTIGNAIEAGVPVYAGTDAGGNIRHGRLVDELHALHRVGLSTEGALAAGSWAARDWLGVPATVNGGVADLLCYDEDPRTNLNVLRRPSRIILRGRVVT